MRTLTDLDQAFKTADAVLDAALNALADGVRDGVGDAAIEVLCVLVDEAEAALIDVVGRQARQSAYIARRDARVAGDMARVAELVDGGMSDELAVELVTGVTVEKQRKRLFLDMVRSEGYTVAGFDEAVTVYTRQWQTQQYNDAEGFTNGFMVRKGSTVDPVKLWSMSEAQVKANASDELLEFFDVFGRVTRESVRAGVLAGKGVVGVSWGR